MPSTCSCFRPGPCVRESRLHAKCLCKLASTEGRWIQTPDKAQSKYMWAWTANWQWLSKRVAPGSLLPRWLLNWSLYLFMKFATVMNIHQPGFSIVLTYRLWLLHRKWLPDPVWSLCWFAALCWMAQHTTCMSVCSVSLPCSWCVVKQRILCGYSRTICFVFTGTVWPRAGSSFGSALACSHPASHCWNMPRSSWRHVRKKHWPWSAVGGFRQWWGKWSSI